MVLEWPDRRRLDMDGYVQSCRSKVKHPGGTRGVFERVYDVVRMIPSGQVATYGQIAVIVSHRSAARVVGWALASLHHGTDVPWHRVVNSRGFVSLRELGQPSEAQRRLLECEGVVVGPQGEVDLQRYQWHGLDWPEVEALRQTWNARVRD